jgi:uncharacterized membrane protein (UPF0127 family)
MRSFRGGWLRLLPDETRVLSATLGLALTLLACQRASDEPAAPEPRPTPLSTTTTSGRCVWPTPASPPPPVAPGPAPGCPPDPRPHTLDLVTVRFPEATSGPAIVSAELARTPADSERGLMFRTSMEGDHGMLFDLGTREVHQFWMHNTCIPLDMIFLDDDGLIVGILENVPTLNDSPRSVPCPSTHVLEVNAGWSRRVGVRAGSHARLPGA